jgi:diadenosine tetraphosphatase ApaH/serine/threonine PP2A family protein phosphatase
LNTLGSPSTINKRWDFLGELPTRLKEGEDLLVHGSPRDATNEYVFPEDIYHQRKMEELFKRIDRYCFQGHTHIPGVFTTSGDFVTPEDCNYVYRLTGQKVMVNVGSVGQPRDNDRRACYVLWDDNQVTFRRIDYDCQKTRDKIHGIPDLDNMLGDRLLSGR